LIRFFLSEEEKKQHRRNIFLSGLDFAAVLFAMQHTNKWKSWTRQ